MNTVELKTENMAEKSHGMTGIRKKCVTIANLRDKLNFSHK